MVPGTDHLAFGATEVTEVPSMDEKKTGNLCLFDKLMMLMLTLRVKVHSSTNLWFFWVLTANVDGL